MQRADRFSSERPSVVDLDWSVWEVVCLDPVCLHPVFWVVSVWMLSLRWAGLSGSWLLMLKASGNKIFICILSPERFGFISARVRKCIVHYNQLPHHRPTVDGKQKFQPPQGFWP